MSEFDGSSSLTKATKAFFSEIQLRSTNIDKRPLSKESVLGLLSPGSMMAHADVADGNGCGWGSMMLESQYDLFPHPLAIITNGTPGNTTFGMTSRTNDCNTSTRLDHDDHSTSAMSGILDNIAEDMAKGQGEALDAYAVLLGVKAKNRAHFAQVTQQRSDEIFVSKNATSEWVLSSTLVVVGRDDILTRYVKRLA